MQLLILIFIQTKRMKKNWKNILLYVVRFLELLVSGAAGGALGSNL